LNENVHSISLDITDAKGNFIRKYSNTDTLYKIPANNVPPYWIRPQQILSAESGSHRFMWDMHYQPLNVPPAYPIAATYLNTAPDPTSPWVMPGMYTARLTVDGKLYAQNFEVKMDPRVQTSVKDLQLQHDLSVMCYNNIQKCIAAKNNGATSLDKIQSAFAGILNILHDSDMPPTAQMISAAKETEKAFLEAIKK
jgi:hypothetical protein